MANVAFVHAVLCRYTGDWGRILELIPAHGPGVPGPADPACRRVDLDLWASWHEMRTAALMWHDDDHAAIDEGDRALDLVAAGATRAVEVTVLGMKALMLATRGRLSDAADAISRVDRAMDLRDWTRMPNLTHSDFAAAWIAMERARPADAHTALDLAERRLAVVASRPALLTLQLLRARLDLLDGVGAVSARARLARSTSELAAIGSPFHVRLARRVEVEVTLMAGDLQEALRLTADGPADGLRAYVCARAGLDPNPMAVAQLNDRGLELRVLLTLAVAAMEAGDVSTADRHLDSALELAAIDGCLLPFVQLGVQARSLMFTGGWAVERHAQLVHRILTECSPLWSAGSDLTEQLSPRELDVLRYMITGQDTAQIADAMFLSANTIRTHTKSIYRKLSVQTRRDAVQRARALGLA